MEEKFKISGYHFTTDPTFQNKKYGVSPELEKQFEQLYYETKDKKNKKIIDKLTQLIIKYPKVPILKNYLSLAYHFQGKHEKAVEVTNWILAEHPDYLFGKLNQANIHIENGEFDKVPEILGESIELKDLYPDRDLFHFAEVTGFLKVAVRYFSAIDELELAENRHEILRDIAPDHPDTEEALSYLYYATLKKAPTQYETELKQKISISPVKMIKSSIKKDAPKFNHPEIQNLYNYGMNIPREKVEQIIALPHDSLVEDLEKTLEDAVERHYYFSNIEFSEDADNFVLHALFLLKEINATESLPKILSFLKNDSEFMDMWLGDHLTETIWQCIYCLGQNNTNILKDFILQPGLDTYSKSAVAEALAQMVMFHPEKRAEILSIFSEVLTVFSESSIEDNLIDSDFLGLLIGECLGCNFQELLPIIKNLYEKEYVSLSINGTYKVVEADFLSNKQKSKKAIILSIFEIYDTVLKTWSAYRDEDESFEDYKPQPAVSTKIGRNDPCPCGSGKKHKKCCLDK